jgi:hypothetical protein
MDGLALAHLDCIDNASQSDFGSERMFGAAFWGVGSLCAGIGIDRYGFVFLYVMTILTAVASYVSMWLYLYGIKCDTTGSFVVMGTSSSSSSSLQSKVVLENANNDRNNCLESNNLLEEDNHNLLSSNNNDDDELVENEEETTSGYTSSQLFNLICQTGYGRALLFFVFSLAVGISIVDNLAFIFFDSLGSSNTINGLTVVFTVVSHHLLARCIFRSVDSTHTYIVSILHNSYLRFQYSIWPLDFYNAMVQGSYSSLPELPT